MKSALRSPKLLPFCLAVHPCLNQVRSNEISSNVQIKPNQISLDKKKKKNKKILSVSLTQRTKSSDAFSILHKKKIQIMTIILEIVTYIIGSKAQGLHLWLCQ